MTQHLGTITQVEEFPWLMAAFRAICRHRDSFTDEEWADVGAWLERGLLFMERNASQRHPDPG